MLTTAWAGGRAADKTGVETQTPPSLSLTTRDHARAALARAFEEAAVMPGTLLPHEILTELRDVASRIVDEVPPHDDHGVVGNSAEPALYLVEHSIDATVLGLSMGRRLAPEDSLGELGIGLFIQDIGKLALPPSLVHKPGPLGPDEWELMMQHPLLGLEFLRDDTISAPGEVGGALAPRALGRLGLSRRAGRRGDPAVLAHRRGGRRLRRRHERAFPRAAVPPQRGRRPDPHGFGQHVRPARSSRRSSTSVRPLAEQVERRADDRLGVDLVVAVDVLEVAGLSEARDARAA